jgi:hypothetical protein
VISQASFGRSELDINTIGTNFEKIHLSNYSEGAAIVWPKSFENKFQLFKERLLARYKAIRLTYLKQYEMKIIDHEREKLSKVECKQEKLDKANEKKQKQERRLLISFGSVDNLAKQFHQRSLLKRYMGFLQNYAQWKKYLASRKIYCDNFYQRKLMRTHFKLLCSLTHQDYREKVLKERDAYKEKQLQSLLFTQDVKIDNLKLYLA